jgi:hypothetical protein
MPAQATSPNGFTIRCPSASDQASPVAEIRSRGNIPIVLEDDFVVEISPREFSAGWRQTMNLGQRRLDLLVATTAARIQAALEDDISEATPDLAADTTAFYLFALRQKGLSKPRALEQCELHWSGREAVACPLSKTS